MSPSFYLLIEEVLIDDKMILYIYVPESSQVHRFLRKQTSYSENKIYPYAELIDLRVDVIARVRNLALIQRNDHPWGAIDD